MRRYVFPMVFGSGGSKSRLAKAVGAEPSGQMKMRTCMALWREAHVHVKMHKTHHARTTFEVAMSKKCTRFWPEAHFEVRSVKTYGLGPLLEAEMF